MLARFRRPGPAAPDALAADQAEGGRWPALWVASSAWALGALAYWLQEPGWGRLLAVVVGTAAAAGCLPVVRRPRTFAMATVGALVVGCIMAGLDTASLLTVRDRWVDWSVTERGERAERVARSIEATAAGLREASRSMATDTALVARLQEDGRTLLAPPTLPGGTATAAVVYHNGRLVRRAGQLFTPIQPTCPAGVRLVDGVFHTSLVACAYSEDRRTVVLMSALIASAPPADQFARSLLQTLPNNVDVDHTSVESPDSSFVTPGATVVVVTDGTQRLARIRATTYTEGETLLRLEQHARARIGVALALALICFLVVAWRRPAATLERIGAALTVLMTVALAPLAGLSNVSGLLDPRSYFAPHGGPLTSTIAALIVTAALVLAVCLFAIRTARQRPSKVSAVALVLVGAVGGPLLLRDLARGITVPPAGAGFSLWMAWQLGLALVGVTVLLVAAAAGQTALGSRRGLPPLLSALVALAAGALAPVLWEAPGTWPIWYSALWVLAMASLAFTRGGLAQVAAAAVVAGVGATTLTWSATIRARIALAQHDITRIGESDLDAQRLLERFAISLRDEVRPVRSSEVLLRRFASSELARAGYAARLARWTPAARDSAVSVLELTPVTDTVGAQAYLAVLARETGAVEIREARDGLTRLLLAAVPAPDGVVTTVAVPPRTSLQPVDPFSAFTGVTGARRADPPYRLAIGAALPDDAASPTLAWRRRGNALHGDGVAGDSVYLSRVHVEVELGGLDLLPRGALLVLFDVAIVMLLWAVTALADGALTRLLTVRRVRWSRSYRVRLSGALLGFFITPAAIFALWAWYRLQDDDRAARELLVRETLRVAAAEQEQRPLDAGRSSTGAPLFLYRNGLLVSASDPLLEALAPLGRVLPVTLTPDDFGSDDIFTTRRLTTGVTRTLVGYRQLMRTTDTARATLVLATPARGDEFALDERREDLGVLVLFATMLGALAASWSSGVAARALARPVRTLREAALAIAAGRPAPGLGTVPATEFAPVYRAFTRMAGDLTTGRAALEAAQRRTAAVLQHVASGVVAMLRDGAITLANPRAVALLNAPVQQVGASLDMLPDSLRPLVQQCHAFLDGNVEEEAFELSVGTRQLQARLTRLPSGAVLTLDDITDLASAQRVLAWGEMARQVAHEIKNPLTPIRLGVQHLRRAYRDGRGDFAHILDTNVARVLEEIDHLDEIARAFSRYGTAPSERAPTVAVDVRAVVDDVVALERLGDHAEQGQRVAWVRDLPDAGSFEALAQRDELREVLINLLENARLAGASRVAIVGRAIDGHLTLEVIDDGAGIAAHVLPQVFEPHFSTRTSGSGLGLAISRRLIEGWGGTVGLTSIVGQGTTVRITLPRAGAPAREASGELRR